MLNIERNPEDQRLTSGGSTTATFGGVLGLNLQYKKQLSFSLDSSINFANLNVQGADTSSIYYKLGSSLSYNF